ncbi:type II toxin-antitoxin system HicA family toxin [Candidatus Galacturonibacter soehngenii]|uniref:type II toxin-antitoxin system HicA family toxin n=1 Tax=Candidatus Galacturonatibacter soehngenii TaxID=2307010 RepID=UPI001A9ADA82
MAKNSISRKLRIRKVSSEPPFSYFARFQQRLKREGFQKTGQSGSHEKWKKGNRTVTVPNHVQTMKSRLEL